MQVLNILDPSTMKPFTVRDWGDKLVVEIEDLVLVLNRRLEKTHIVLRSLEIGLTLDAPLEAIGELERLLRRRLSSGGCLGSC